MIKALRPHRDRLFPADPSERAIARRLYDTVAGLPILSPHGHVDAQLLVEDEAFANPAALLVQPDHYVTRLLHAQGIPLEDLGVGQGPLADDQARRVWRLLCANWSVFRGTPVRYWLESELAEIFGVTQRPTQASADQLYDEISAALASDEYRSR